MDSRSLRELLTDLSGDVRLLCTQTIGLAKAEVNAATSTIAVSLAGIAAGAAIAIAGLLVLVSALVLIAIALGLPPWAAALLVGVLLTAGGAFTAQLFVARLRTVQLDLRETRASIAETVEWLRAQTTK